MSYLRGRREVLSRKFFVHFQLNPCRPLTTTKMTVHMIAKRLYSKGHQCQNIAMSIHLDTFRNKSHQKMTSIETEFQETDNENLAIHRLINDAASSKEIVGTIRDRMDQITHGSVYGLAMNKCSKTYKDYHSMQQVMDILLSPKNTTTRIERIAFNIFLNQISHCDVPRISVKYFSKMINEHHITPDLFTFSSLIKSCRLQKKYALAHKYLKLMRRTFRIEPNEFIFNEMLAIHSKSQNVSKAKRLFKEYLIGFEGNYNIITFNAYLSVFCSAGDIDGITKCLKLMNEHGMNPDMITFTHLMSGYNAAKKPKKCLKIFDKIIEDKQWKPSSAQLFYKSVALCLLLKNEKNYKIQKELYAQIESVVFSEFERYGLTKNALIGKVLFEAAIYLHHNVDPLQIVSVFESLLQQKLIGFMHKNGIDIDLHCFVPLQAQFILRYVFGLKINELLIGEEVCIITGIGKHASSEENKGKLREFVVNELLSYEPPIRCTVHKNNPGRLLLNNSDVRHYRKNKQNYCWQKINNPSNDWKLDEVL